MKANTIPSYGTHEAIRMVPEFPFILSTVCSQLRSEFGHGVTWKTGAAYVTLKDYSTVAVPRRFLKSAMAKFGNAVLRVRES